MKRGASPEAPAGRRRGSFVGPLLAANVLVVGVTVTLLTVGGLRAAQRQNADRVMDQRTTVARAAVTAEAGRYLSLLRAVAAGIGTNSGFTGTDFDAATAPLETAGLLGAISVGFLVPSPRGADDTTQSSWRARGATGLVLKPSGNPQEHFYLIFTRTLNNGGPGFAGLDAVASTEASVALGEARRTGRTTVSDTYVLLRDRGLPLAEQQLSFAFVAPVYTAGADPAFRGWIVLGLHGQDFLGGVLGIASQGQLAGELLATNGDGRQVEVASHSAPGTPELRRQASFPVANRQWTLVTRANAAVLPGARSNLPITVLLGGVVFTAMLAWLVYTLATGRSKARSQVRVATAELRTADAASRRQAGLLGAIMASLGDGVGVVDGDGEFLLHNPAAKALLGVSEDVGGPDHWQSHYGLFRPDGRTPFPVEEMPLVRALRGESSDHVEMLVRNSARPDGILLSVDGRPLDASAGQHGGVAVFHDITELRQYETDLSVFAGVVAHDLKAPLAIVRGHCETAVDELTDAPDSPAVDEARAALGRVAAGVDRMAGLIDTLLAYTTSRDAPLHPRTISLGALVADAVTDRIGHLRPSAGPAPDVYVGRLPDVDADPAMLRHVVDNLIGNSLKYVQAGRAARIDVTAGPAAAGWTRVEVADRGIGIPDEDKPNIFESFHRAPTAAGYAGTGLGLAICRRIVERHGGAIGVTDNPGGGTRFHFTLPLAGTMSTPQPAPPAPEVTMPQPYTMPDALARSDRRTEPAAGSGGADADRAALQRASAERSAAEQWATEHWAVERAVLPGMFALPATGPSARESSAARLQAPVPDHHHGD